MLDALGLSGVIGPQSRLHNDLTGDARGSLGLGQRPPVVEIVCPAYKRLPVVLDDCAALFSTFFYVLHEISQQVDSGCHVILGAMSRLVLQPKLQRELL